MRLINHYIRLQFLLKAARQAMWEKRWALGADILYEYLDLRKSHWALSFLFLAPDALHQLGDCLLMQGLYLDAIAAYETYLRFDPYEDHILVDMAEAMHKMKYPPKEILVILRRVSEWDVAAYKRAQSLINRIGPTDR
jgi:tetratricopeptide (TPR) repeat protein